MKLNQRVAELVQDMHTPFCLQIVLIVATGVLVGWVGNALSPRGLDLSRDYFPALPVATTTNSAVLVQPPGADSVSAEATTAAAIPNHTPSPSFGDVLGWLQSAEAADGRLIFIDARTQALFEEGHIPGAYLLDRFYPEQGLPEVLPAAMAAERIIVYCTGGDCEDSEYAALMLQEAGVPVERIMVYSGGITEWQESRGPVEIGQRLSGVQREFENP